MRVLAEVRGAAVEGGVAVTRDGGAVGTASVRASDAGVRGGSARGSRADGAVTGVGALGCGCAGVWTRAAVEGETGLGVAAGTEDAGAAVGGDAAIAPGCGTPGASGADPAGGAAPARVSGEPAPSGVGFRGGGSGLDCVPGDRAAFDGDPDGTGRAGAPEYQFHANQPAANSTATTATRPSSWRAPPPRLSGEYPSVASTASACAVRRVPPCGREVWRPRRRESNRRLTVPGSYRIKLATP